MALRCALPSACSVAYVKSTASEAWILARLRLLKQNILQNLELLVKMRDVIVPKFCKISNICLLDKGKTTDIIDCHAIKYNSPFSTDFTNSFCYSGEET